jgi:hypothetical protein
MLMRCTMPHWQGNTAVPTGTLVDADSGEVLSLPNGIRPVGLQVSVIPLYFETFETDEMAPVGRRAKKAAR